MKIRLVKNEKLTFLDALYIRSFSANPLFQSKKGGSTYFTSQIHFPSSFRIFFNYITQHRAWHFHIMFLQKIFFNFNFSFANLPQRPTDSFLNQVLFVNEQDFHNFQSIIKFILSDKIKSGDDQDSTLPQVISINQTVKLCFVFFVQIRTYNITRGNINNVPVFDKSMLSKYKL